MTFTATTLGGTEQVVTITITGTNDVPVVAAALTAGADEGANAFTVDLLNGVSDVDQGDTAFTISGVTGLEAGVSMNVDGVTLDVDPTNAAFDSLALNETQEIAVGYNIVDATGALVAQTAVITITGTNDLPVVTAALTAEADEGASAFTVDLLNGVSDVDQGDTAFTISGVTGLEAGVSMNVDGVTLDVDPTNAAFDSLALNETQEITVGYNIVDATGALVAQTTTITITGTNDAPVVTEPVTLVDQAEDQVAPSDYSFTSETLLANASDVDIGLEDLGIANLTADVDGTITNNDGTYTFTPTDANFNGLVTLSYDVVDGDGGSASTTALLTITPVNDAPTVEDVLSGAGTEDGAVVTVNLLDGASDVDIGDSVSVDPSSITGLTNAITLGADGFTLSVDPSHSDFQSLAEGITSVVTISYNVVDGNGGSVAQTATITLTGTNDAPVVTAGVASTTEDSTGVDIDVASLMSDVDGDDLTIAAVSVPAEEGTVSINGTVITFVPLLNYFGDATISYTVSDGTETVTNTITVAVASVNDAPDAVPVEVLIGGEGSLFGDGHIDEDVEVTIEAATIIDALVSEPALDVDHTNQELTFFVTVVDPASPDAVVLTTTFSNGTFLGASNVSFTPPNNFFGTLAVSIEVFDGALYSEITTFDITVDSVNDAPTVAAALSASANEGDESFTLNLLDGVNDVDTNDILSVANVTGLVAGLTLVDSILTIDPTDPAFQALLQGEEQEITVGYNVIDSQGGVTPQTAIITLTGTNAVPVIAYDVNSVNVDENQNIVISGIDVNAIASDGDGDTLTLSLSGDDASLFNLIATDTGQDIVFIDTPDFEIPTDVDENNIYDLQLVVTDTDGGVATHDLDVNINNIASVTLDGTPNIDLLVGEEGNDIIHGLGDDDVIKGLAGNDELFGGIGADELFGGAGIDELYGEDGNDHLYFDATDAVVDGGAGYDIAHVSGSVNLSTVGLNDVEQVHGSDLDDNLYGAAITTGQNLHGLAGNDVLTGGSGHDFIFGGDGVDRLTGNIGADRMYAGAGNDYLFFDGDDGAVSGGAGWDIGYTSGIVDLSTIGFTGVEQVIGGNGADEIDASGLNQNIHLYGNAGDDILTGSLTGENYFNGGDGNDTLFGGDIGDRMYAGSGNDSLYFGAEDIVINGGAGWDTGYIDGDVDLAAVTLTDVELVLGGANSDTIDASGLVDTIRLYGQGGDDVLIGGSGDDYLYGQGGSDTYVFVENWGTDVVGDFNTNGEQLDFIALDIAFADLTIEQVGANTSVYITAEGDNNAVTLNNIDFTTIDETDFIF